MQRQPVLGPAASSQEKQRCASLRAGRSRPFRIFRTSIERWLARLGAAVEPTAQLRLDELPQPDEPALVLGRLVETFVERTPPLAEAEDGEAIVEMGQ